MNEIRNRIVELASERFFKDGYSRVTTDELANELGVSKRTIYQHFPSKESLLQSVVQKCHNKAQVKLQEIVDNMEADPEYNFLKSIIDMWSVSSDNTSKFTKEFVLDIQKYSPKTFEDIQQFREQEMKKHFFRIARIGKERGFFKEDINEKLFYFIKNSIFSNILKPEIMMDLPMTVEEVIQTIYSILFTGILTEKGKENFQKMKSN